MIDTKTFIYGKHALAEALTHARRAVSEVFLAKQFDDQEFITFLKKSGISVINKLPSGIDATAVHQGVVATVSFAHLIRDYEEFAEQLKVGSETSLVLLAEVQDPQNVGAVIRSAAAFGVSGVLIPEHNQAQITGAVAKVSAGMAFRVPLVSIGNINTTLRDLKDRGFAVYGLSGDAKYVVTKEEFALPTVFVLGNESEGMREKTKELCDKLLSIPMHPQCESLNAATSASIAFYAWSAKHPKALRI
ncbi:MAG: 23S rRNA (guanosine(2251)-2'-O)-methyltransferase RlmB [Candidatus Taylorbacteria bacterium]|nr:23S rRNA (guanosine(2251)-2'-O)-methyltransferase RlmB [Candidatus Taylorbacteria bacterium]